MALSNEKFIGITILYADNLNTFGDSFDWDLYAVDQEVTEADYMQQPMSKRIAWTEALIKDGEGAQIFVLTNDYQFMNLLEHACDKDKFRIYDGDNDVVVMTFIDLKPNPTLAVGEYLFRCSVKRALKGG